MKEYSKLKLFSHSGLEAAVIGVTASSKEWLYNYIKDHLESNIHFSQKADLLAYSLTALDNKISFVNEEIKNLQAYKKSLMESSLIAREIIADVFNEEGITKLEGSSVSSITISKPLTASKLTIDVKDEEKLIDMGYVIKNVDIKAIEKDYLTGNIEIVEQLKEYVTFKSISKTMTAKAKVNKRRSNNNNKYLSKDIDEAA